MAKVIKAPWKIKLNPEGNGPYAVMIRLLDYMKRYDPEVPEWTERTSSTALALPHDIIAHNPDIYDPNDGTLLSEALLEDVQKYGIYLSKVIYDARAKPVSEVTSGFEFGESYNNNGNKYYIYNPADALPPLEDDIRYPGDDSWYSSVTVSTGGTDAAGFSFVVLERQDSVLAVNLSAQPCIPYTRVRFNIKDPNTGNASDEAVNIVRFFTGFAGSNADALNPDINTALKYTYVWFRCSYFADYVRPDSFNQGLTESDDVRHKNLIIGSGDFQRFARKSTIEPIAVEEEATTPYLPATPPRTDLLPILTSSSVHNNTLGAKTFEVDLSPEEASAYKVGFRIQAIHKLDTSIPVTLEGIILKYETVGDAYNLTIYVDKSTGGVDGTDYNSWTLPGKGSFLIPALEGEWDIKTDARRAPVGWFDPDVDSEASYLPPSAIDHTVPLPPTGNFYTSGRIFSPTIDELWVYVKKMVDGRTNDDNTAYEDPDPLSGPRASIDTRTIGVDTRLPQEVNLALSVGGVSKYGDPLTTTGTSSFVNESRGIQYAVNANLEYIANIITSETLESYYPFTDYSSSGDWSTRTASRALPGIVLTSDHWAPRTNPYSLRELEAYIKNVEYNLELAFNFIAANKVSTGNTDDNDTLTANTNKQGTLYQVHVDYVSNLNSVEKEDSSRWKIDHTNTVLPTNESVRDSTGAILYGIDRTSPGYANSTNTYNRLTDIPQEDVYMSAEGKWRYLFDHIRVPIINDLY